MSFSVEAIPLLCCSQIVRVALNMSFFDTWAKIGMFNFQMINLRTILKSQFCLIFEVTEFVYNFLIKLKLNYFIFQVSPFQ